MNPKLKNALAVIVGIIVGSIANMVLVVTGPVFIPPPDGVDVTNMESIRSSMHMFEFKHFVFPFVAHALGTLAGAYLAVVMAASRRMVAAMVVGGFFLIGRHHQRRLDSVARLVYRRGPGWRLHTYGVDRCKIGRKSVRNNG